ncbi:Phosphoglycerol transferase MdoB [Xylanibacter ruminicola]|uniref:Phosphoglycerol transferase MdoB n=1 Tax=Xylanibacter ruminicola TaxID=839 RepID=A0A1H5XDM2_XYLRU|nr:LTA synthase family protein [Xylanibacter ruminicola]SEG09743.1 Phosphoglycerol transferase MdoB [Xylanibacter ruminicola]
MRQRLIYLIKVYALTVILFMVAKVVFMWANHEGHAFSAGDVWDVISHGLSLDLSTALYALIVPFLISIGSIWTESRWLRRILCGYYTIIAIAFTLAFVADTSLYPFWGFKLNAVCLQYFDNPAEIGASVSGLYMAIRLLLIIIGAIAIWWMYFRIPMWDKKPSNKKLSVIGDLLLIPLFIIGIRGGIDESTTNIGQVYYSQEQFLNHSAVNPVFSFLYSLSHQMGDTSKYNYMEEEECEALVKGVFTTESTFSDTLLTTTRPNIAIILLESCGEEFASVMPRLQQLKKEGIYFSQCYGNSWRTDRGTVCTLSGYPSFPSLSVMKMPEKSRSLPSIARTLQQENYKTCFLYGGDINFTNMRSYLISTGWEKLTWKADYTAEEQSTAQWGVRDDITFQTLHDQISKADPTGRLLIGYSTLSSHEPWDVPTKELDDEVLNAFRYLDNCLGDFIDRMKSTAAWDNLLIVLVADHGINYKNIDEQRPLERNHIPMLWLGGAVKGPRTVNILCNQTDICATLLGQMRLNHEDFRFSRDVLSKSYHYPTAVHNYNNAQLLIDSTGHILYDFDAKRFTVSNSKEPERMLRLNKAILQVTTKDLKER